MGRLGNLRLGSINGIGIDVDWSLLIIFFLITFSLAAGVFPAWHPDWSPILSWTTALAAAVLLHERIETTQARAKITKSAVEKMITRAKTPGVTTIRILTRDLPRNAVKKAMEVLGPRYATRPGGYTRIIHNGQYKDGTSKVFLELVK